MSLPEHYVAQEAHCGQRLTVARSLFEVVSLGCQNMGHFIGVGVDVNGVPGTSMVSLSSRIPKFHLAGVFSPESCSPPDFREKREPHGRRGGEVCASCPISLREVWLCYNVALDLVAYTKGR